jgi:hypothetical protein
MEDKKKSLWTKAEKLIFVGGGIALLVVIVWAFFLINLQSELDNKLAELRKKGILTTWDELAEWYEGQPVDPATNQAYQNAFQARVDLDDSKRNDVLIEGKAILLPDEKLIPKKVLDASQKYLGINKKALELLHKAAKMENCRFQVDHRKGPETLLPHLNEVRTATKLLAMEAVFAARIGESETCFRAFSDALKISKIIENEPSIIAYLVNLACVRITINNLQWCPGKVEFNDVQYKKLSEQLQEKLKTDDKQLNAAFLGEFAMFLDERCVDYIYNDFFSFRPPSLPWYDRFLSSPATITLSGMGNSNRLKYAEILEEKLRICKLPYKQGIIAINNLENDIKKLNHWYYKYIKMTFFSLSSLIEKRERFRMNLQVAITGLAVERFRLKYHRLPDKLEELVPEFIAEVPVDSFQANNGKLKYLKKVFFEYDKLVDQKATESSNETTVEKVEYPGYTVYSIGEDKTDQHGLLTYCKDKSYNSDIIWAVMGRDAKPLKTSK